MTIFKWANKGVKKFVWYDVSLVKLSTAAVVLLLAKYFPVLLSYEWPTYVIVAVVAGISPLKKMFCKK